MEELTFSRFIRAFNEEMCIRDRSRGIIRNIARIPTMPLTTVVARAQISLDSTSCQEWTGRAVSYTHLPQDLPHLTVSG